MCLISDTATCLLVYSTLQCRDPEAGQWFHWLGHLLLQKMTAAEACMAASVSELHAPFSGRFKNWQLHTLPCAFTAEVTTEERCNLPHSYTLPQNTALWCSPTLGKSRKAPGVFVECCTCTQRNCHKSYGHIPVYFRSRATVQPHT